MSDTNFEKLLPKLSTYTQAMEKDHRRFISDIGAGLDHTKWEDRFILLSRVASNGTLEKDNRVPFYKFQNEIIDQFDDMIHHYSWEEVKQEMYEDYGIEDTFDLSWLETIYSNWSSYSKSIKKYKLMNSDLRILWSEIYPPSMVHITELGKVVQPIVETAMNNKEIATMCQDTVTNLIMTIEQMAYRVVELKAQGVQNLFLHKEDFDWQSIVNERLKIDDMEWLYRNYDCCNALEDWYHNPFDNSTWNYPTFIIDYILDCLAKDFCVDLSTYTQSVKTWYEMHWICSKNEFVQCWKEDYEMWADNVEHWNKTMDYKVEPPRKEFLTLEEDSEEDDWKQVFDELSEEDE